MTTPYESECEAVTAMRAVMPPEPGEVILSREQRRRYLAGVLTAAGVDLSDFEARTGAWLCGFEDYTIAIIARWIAAAARNEPQETTEGGTRS